VGASRLRVKMEEIMGTANEATREILNGKELM